eukprot:1850685-Prymnesium_polylepis.1
MARPPPEACGLRAKFAADAMSAVNAAPHWHICPATQLALLAAPLGCVGARLPAVTPDTVV